jgi:hypothetical protein
VCIVIPKNGTTALGRTKSAMQRAILKFANLMGAIAKNIQKGLDYKALILLKCVHLIVKTTLCFSFSKNKKIGCYLSN